MLIVDQVATAPCTDLVQKCFRTFEAKPVRNLKYIPRVYKIGRRMRQDESAVLRENLVIAAIRK